MPDEAFQWMGKIKAVEREYAVIRCGTDRLLKAMDVDPQALEHDIRRRDVRVASARLEGTYIIRVFAEFETALQQFIRDLHIRKPGSTEALVNRVRDRGHIPQSIADCVHDVRNFRNVLVHDRVHETTPVNIRDATSYLCTFLSRLQRMW